MDSTYHFLLMLQKLAEGIGGGWVGVGLGFCSVFEGKAGGWSQSQSP